jgi:3-deoxy-D-manno-octulosonic-acid transferase
MTLARLLYTALLFVTLPFIFLRLGWRAFKQPGYLRHVGERFGIYRGSADRAAIWIHAVSVGETRAAQPLVDALHERYPHGRILMTYMTPTGRTTGESLFGDRVLHCYLPYDYPLSVARFLERFQPRLAVIMETEIWFNLLAECARRSIPACLVNARLSPQSAQGYARISALVGEALASLHLVTAQSDTDAVRLRALGARDVHVCGNLKFDITPDPVLAELGRKWRATLDPRRKVLLAASTREGEEALILEAFKRVSQAQRQRILLVIVPRHPQRFDAVAGLIDKTGFTLRSRSTNTSLAEVQIWLGDSMGEMAAYYALCDVAFIGGSLLPFGAQNLIEACAQGKPVLIGPHDFNFAEVTQLAIERGAAVRVETALALMEFALRVLNDDVELGSRSAAARGFAAEHQGATKKTMALIAPLLTDL